MSDRVDSTAGTYPADDGRAFDLREIYDTLVAAKEAHTDYPGREPEVVYCPACDETWIDNVVGCDHPEERVTESTESSEISAWVNCIDHLQEQGLIVDWRDATWFRGPEKEESTDE